MSFWLPGQYGSFAAAEGAPGFSVPVVYYHYSGDLDADVVLPRGGQLTAGAHADVDLALVIPTVTLAPKVLAGQLSFGVAAAFGHQKVRVDAVLEGPNGEVRSGSATDTVTGFGDLYPSASLRWSSGYFSGMAYLMGGIPVGTYVEERLANLGTNHGSLDTGGGFTYLNTKGGHEFSVVTGATYNFENPATDYQNGISLHVDLAASQFLSEDFHLGLVGYHYTQLTGDDAPAPLPSDLKSRVFAGGVQFGYFLDIGRYRPYANLKGYYEFAAKNRPEGFDIWLTLAIPFTPTLG